MNLLVSAAAGERSRSDLISLTDSPQRNTHMVEDSCMGEDARSKSSHGNNLPQDQNRALATSLEMEKPVPPYPTIYQQERVLLLWLPPQPVQQIKVGHDEESKQLNENAGTVTNASGSSSYASLEIGNENKSGDHKERKALPGHAQSEQFERNDEEPLHNFCTPPNEIKVLAGLGSAVNDQKSESMEANVEDKDVLEKFSGGAYLQKESALRAKELEQHAISRGSNMTGAEADVAEENASTTADVSSSPAAEHQIRKQS
ncbi:hypothetical protein Acr_15g0014750 [Actinidia rufa]|uniref:Uncharacterized protein n=1 Tax=Actinidia rufa TaxID=165716 RepID=A0A7J0FWM6_9ERIC|nr:hypothetical protein Acr_15g0014750 [Actinidia rufa]